ncbi:MAG TPA: alpha/beta hydrolase family protein [Anaerolineae bacterium]|nr:alpha/beta hydrolase family protein [Anaerolineae bacterium]HQI84607.1 alpha/beta hydrolase family protein [Anaerolineae bacterium]
MALLRLDHVPEAVKVNLPLYMIVPDPGEMKGIPMTQRKVLYLLHGLSDDGSAWQRYTAIETLAAAYGLVVVMPSVGRSFYIDQPNGQKYFSYLTEELPRYLADVFGLMPRREDTFIAGNSMGGYGAIKAALLHPELYVAAASFSGVLSLEILKLDPNDKRREEFALLFGDLSRLAGSEHDPAAWLQRAAQNPAALPHLFIAVGRQEDLYPLSGHFHAACQALGVASEYHEEDGHHDWFLWDRQIRQFLAAILGPIPIP